MKKNTLLSVATSIVMVVSIVVGADWYLSLPVAQVDPDGRCRRVLVIENDREVVRPCNAVAGKIHLTEHVLR